MFRKSLVFVGCIILAILNLSGCSKSNQTSEIQDNRIQICVTFNAMKEFVEAVGKDKVEVTTMVPDGSEPHDFEPKAKDMVQLSDANIFVYNGLGMESWVEETLQAVDNTDLIVVDASEDITPISISDAGSEKEQYDPHTWLSLKQAEIQVNAIKNALVEADSSNKEYYESNCEVYITKLENLYNVYNQKFQTVTNKNFVTGHAAFAYLCQDFGLHQKSVEDVFAEGEPSAQQLSQLVSYCKENNVTTIFAESMASPEVSQTLAEELGASVKTIYTIESNEDNKSYLERMEENLSEIYESLAN